MAVCQKFLVPVLGEVWKVKQFASIAFCVLIFPCQLGTTSTSFLERKARSVAQAI